MLNKLESKLYPKFGGGGSSGGGGGGSGVVDYPAYMKTQHETWLTAIASDISTAKATSPYTGVSAFDPATELAAMATATTALNTAVNNLISGSGISLADVSTSITAYLALIALVDSSSEIAALFSSTFSTLQTTLESGDNYEEAVGQYDQALLSAIRTNSLPKFEAGMRDINAVNSTAFIVGEAMIFAEKDRNVAKFASELKLERDKMVFVGTGTILELFSRIIESRRGFVDILVRNYSQAITAKHNYTHLEIERNRLSIVANKEEADENLRIDVSDSKWDVELYQFGANMLAAIGGGVASPNDASKPSTLQSALGGAMSGAAAGAMVGGPWGAAIGGVAGGLMGLLSF